MWFGRVAKGRLGSGVGSVNELKLSAANYKLHICVLYTDVTAGMRVVSLLSMHSAEWKMPGLASVCEAQHVCVQVLVVGKISQAAVLAASAYRTSDTFKAQTGLIKSRLIDDKQHHDTKVQITLSHLRA